MWLLLTCWYCCSACNQRLKMKHNDKLFSDLFCVCVCVFAYFPLDNKSQVECCWGMVDSVQRGVWGRVDPPHYSKPIGLRLIHFKHLHNSFQYMVTMTVCVERLTQNRPPKVVIDHSFPLDPLPFSFSLPWLKKYYISNALVTLVTSVTRVTFKTLLSWRNNKKKCVKTAMESKD